MDGFPISVRFPIHWSEMDSYGHVNNARYFVWFESARIAYLARVGLVSAEAGSPVGGIGPILAATSADYLRPVTFPAEVEVGARVSRIGTSSITMEYAVQNATTGVQHARGSAVIVTMSYPAYEKVPVPEQVRAAMEALEGRALSSAR